MSAHPEGEAAVSEQQSETQIVTFLFTDVEGSTRLWEADPRAMSVALARHDALLQGAIENAGGAVFKTAGDAFCAVFGDPAAAIAAAVAAQRALASEAVAAEASLKVRMAIHTGHAEQRGGDYFGPPLNRIARLLATTHGEQIVVSRAASELARDHLTPELVLRDLGEHALKDLQYAERVFQVVAPGLRSDFPRLRTPRHLLRNVPQPATPLIGREREAALARTFLGLQRAQGNGDTTASLLQDDREPARLITLTGPGGAGKTRLALHLVAELGVSFTDGAAFVSLATLTDPALVPAEIVAALDLGEPGGDASRDFLVAELRDRHLLLVLDNFEQVMGAAPLVSDLLSQCPRLSMVITSRERLSLRGEQELSLPPLTLPDSTARPASREPALGESEAVSLAEIGQSEAVRLFVERARSVKADFELTTENAAAVVAICHRLDGLPLAIELAAARARFLAPRAMLDRLDRFDRRLDLLSRGQRDLPPRQQTMRDTIAWSYHLLDPAEQRLFSRLAVFVGGATPEACVAIAADLPGDDSGTDPFELVESLAEKSLLQLTNYGDETRVMMFETIRDFAQERLAERAEREIISQRHAEHFLRLAEDAEPQLAASEQSYWLDRLERDQANLRAAIGWLRDVGQTEEALRLGGALWRFWWLRGDMAEGRGHLETLLREPSPAAPAVRAKALNGAGVLAESQGDLECAERFHQESLEISRSLGDLQGVAWSLNNLGAVAISQGDYERARLLLEENLAVAEGAGDTTGIATALLDLGRIAHNDGERERARTLFTRSLDRFRELGDEASIARALNNLGLVLFAFDEHDQAHALLSESLTLHRHVGDRQGIASTLNNLAGAASRRGDFETAMGYFRESHMLARAERNDLYAAIAMEGLATLTHLHGDERVAHNRFREALRLYRGVGDQQGIIACLTGLASGAASQGRPREAAAILGAATEMCERYDHPPPPQIAETAQALQKELGGSAFEAAWQKGKTLDLDEVVNQITEAGRPADAQSSSQVAV